MTHLISGACLEKYQRFPVILEMQLFPQKVCNGLEALHYANTEFRLFQHGGISRRPEPYYHCNNQGIIGTRCTLFGKSITGSSCGRLGRRA